MKAGDLFNFFVRSKFRCIFFFTCFLFVGWFFFFNHCSSFMKMLYWMLCDLLSEKCFLQD